MAGSLTWLKLGLCSTNLRITKLNHSRPLTIAPCWTVQPISTHLEGEPEQGGGGHVKGEAPRLFPSCHAPCSSPLPRVTFHHNIDSWHIGVHCLLGEGLHLMQQVVTSPCTSCRLTRLSILTSVKLSEPRTHIHSCGCCCSLGFSMLGADR